MARRMAVNFGKVFDGVPIQRARASAQIGQVAAATIGRQKLFVPPVLGGARVPNRVEVIAQQIPQAALEAGTREHIASRVDRKQPIGGSTRL